MVISNPPPALEYIELMGSAQVALVNGWTDWDLSGSIPVGAKFVEVVLSNDQIAANSLGSRVNGSVLNRIVDFAGVLEKVQLTCACDTNRIIEVRKTAAGNATAFLLGYWR